MIPNTPGAGDGFGPFAARCGYPWLPPGHSYEDRCSLCQEEHEPCRQYAVCWDAEGRKACGKHSEDLARLKMTIPIRRRLDG